jgi:hypothetical protein
VAGNTGFSSGPAVFGVAAGQTLTGGPNALLEGLGANDTFEFRPHFGNDSVIGFNATGSSHDVLQFDHTVFNSFAAVLAHATQVGNNLVITADGADMVTLNNVNNSAVQASDVHII